MEFSEVLQARHTVRDFRDECVPNDVIRQIVSEAQSVPTWCNSQPFHVYVATGHAATRLREVHLEKAQAKLKGYSDIVPIAPQDWPQELQTVMGQWTVEFKEAFEPGQVHFSRTQRDLFNAPTIAYITIPHGLSAWSIYDAGAFAYGMTLSAASRGVDTVIAYEFVKYPDEVREVLELPESEELVIGIGLGYASDDPINNFVPSRRDLDDILTVCKHSVA